MEQEERNRIIIILFNRLLSDENTKFFRFSNCKWSFENRKILKEACDIECVTFDSEKNIVLFGDEPRTIRVHITSGLSSRILIWIEEKEHYLGDKLLENLSKKFNEDLSGIK